MNESVREPPGRDYAVQYAAVAAGGFAAFLVTAYVGATYLGAFDFASVLSFQANDWPFNIRTLPDSSFAVGIHYFGDFLATWRQSAVASPYVTDASLWPSNYPPAVHLLFRPLTWLPYHVALFVFLTASAVAVIGPMWFAFRTRPAAQRVLLVVSGVVLTGPFLSMLDRGNLQGVVSGLVIVAALLLASRRDLWAAICIGLAAALKGYPLILIVILIHRRRWRVSAGALGVFCGITLLALLTFGGGIAANLEGLWSATSPFRNLEVGGETVVPAYNNSLYSFLQVAGAADVPGSNALLTHYGALVAVLALVVVVVALLPRLSLVERLIALCSFTILAPTITGSYALTLLLAPVAVLALRGTRRWRLPTLYAVLIGLAMVPKALPIGSGDVTVASVVNPMLVVMLLTAVAISGASRATAAVGASRPTSERHAT
jgi:hypothetical protein